MSYKRDYFWSQNFNIHKFLINKYNYCHKKHNSLFYFIVFFLYIYKSKIVIVNNLLKKAHLECIVLELK